MSKILLLSFAILAFGLSVFAQPKIYEPEKGSAERKVIMNAIRVYDVKRDSHIGGETFKVLDLRVQANWAYANVEQQLPGSIESYGTAHVFLQKTGGKWKVVFSTYNDNNEVGGDGLERLRKTNKTFPKKLADFAMEHLAG